MNNQFAVSLLLHWWGVEIFHHVSSALLLKNPVHLGVVCYCFHPHTEWNGGYATWKLSNSASNAMISYSMVKCKPMEPRIRTSSVLSLNEVNFTPFSDPIKWRIWTRYQASTVRWKRFFNCRSHVVQDVLLYRESPSNVQSDCCL